MSYLRSDKVTWQFLWKPPLVEAAPVKPKRPLCGAVIERNGYRIFVLKQ